MHLYYLLVVGLATPDFVVWVPEECTWEQKELPRQGEGVGFPQWIPEESPFQRAQENQIFSWTLSHVV
jgi:hypothetical protein